VQWHQRACASDAEGLFRPEIVVDVTTEACAEPLRDRRVNPRDSSMETSHKRKARLQDDGVVPGGNRRRSPNVAAAFPHHGEEKAAAALVLRRGALFPHLRARPASTPVMI